MSRTSIATPCPGPYTLSSLPIPTQSRRVSTTSIETTQDDTAELEYTRAVQIDYKNVQPRRKSMFNKRDKKYAPVTIFEDVIEDEELVVHSRPEIGGKTLLGKPAQRLRAPSGLRKDEEENVPEQAQPLQATEPARRRPSITAPQSSGQDGWHTASTKQEITRNDASPRIKNRDGLLKQPRRRTIFIPTNDTSILTIHPGANHTSRLDDSFYMPGLISQQPENHEPLEQHGPAKRPRMSIASAPKRVPLLQVRNNDANATGFDVAGRNGGKENIPPHAEGFAGEKKADSDCHLRKARPSIAGSRLFEPTAASRARQSAVVRDAVPVPHSSTQEKGIARSRDGPLQPQPRLSLLPSPPTREAKVLDRRASVQIERTASDLSPSGQISRFNHERRIATKAARLQQYHILTENLAHPELYEDDWLSHQEVALTEIVNEVLSSAQSTPKQGEGSITSLRQRLIEQYHQPQVMALHKRLNASLQCGALSRPRDCGSPPNPLQDIGLRKRFLGMWLESYNTQSLCLAAEVVFGRHIPLRDGVADTNESTLDPHKNRRALIGLLETFLVELDDIDEIDVDRGDDPNRRWRKMVHRSLMLIWLLDQAKKHEIIQGCLFRSKSPRKSSVAMLHALASLLIPSIGEITRVLRHLDYEVSHTQDPLDEVDYRIKNIAVALRDGIILTRLVEVLLFSCSRMRAAETPNDATVTIQMPDLTVLESVLPFSEGEEYPRILSQHLKMPCLGPVQKAYNVEIALSALHDHGRLGQRTGDITPADIVNGHREKTLSLLWSLVSNHGLTHLVDFKELAADIKRTAGDISSCETENGHLSQATQESLLKRWASVHAAQSGVRISNLTTSFADAKAYAAILEAFADYLPTGSRVLSQVASPNNALLEGRLQTLRCSHAFIKQFRSTKGTIPSRKTTISNLAFLASRLLPLARQCNAAEVIQRAFRLKRSRTVASQRIALMRVAHACATVAQTQQKLISAATVLQRAWRDVLDSRIKKLNWNVELVQASAKGWLLRRRLRRSTCASLQPFR